MVVLVCEQHDHISPPLYWALEDWTMETADLDEVVTTIKNEEEEEGPFQGKEIRRRCTPQRVAK